MSERQIRGRIAVSAAGLQGKGSRKRSVYFTDTGIMQAFLVLCLRFWIVWCCEVRRRVSTMLSHSAVAKHGIVWHSKVSGLGKTLCTRTNIMRWYQGMAHEGMAWAAKLPFNCSANRMRCVFRAVSVGDGLFSTALSLAPRLPGTDV